MRHEHDWTTSSRFCHACGVDGWEVAAGPEAFICHGKPAGNTGRHETPSETGLWDRLRADLNNLGAAYGPITEGDSGSEIITGVVGKEAEGWGCEPDFDAILLAARKKREKENRTLIYDPMSDNGHEWSWNTDACAHCGLTSTAIVEFGDVKCDGGKARNGRLTLSAAMSRPLDWEPRVGHKGVETG